MNAMTDWQRQVETLKSYIVGVIRLAGRISEAEVFAWVSHRDWSRGDVLAEIAIGELLDDGTAVSTVIKVGDNFRPALRAA